MKRIAYKHKATVIGDIEPLMGISRPGVGICIACHQLGPCRRHCRPQTKCAIHVYPRPSCMSTWDDLMGRVECASIDVARLQADDGGAVDDRKPVGAHPSLAVYRDLDDALSS